MRQPALNLFQGRTLQVSPSPSGRGIKGEGNSFFQAEPKYFKFQCRFAFGYKVLFVEMLMVDFYKYVSFSCHPFFFSFACLAMLLLKEILKQVQDDMLFLSAW